MNQVIYQFIGPPVLILLFSAFAFLFENRRTSGFVNLVAVRRQDRSRHQHLRRDAKKRQK